MGSLVPTFNLEGHIFPFSFLATKNQNIEASIRVKV